MKKNRGSCSFGNTVFFDRASACAGGRERGDGDGNDGNSGGISDMEKTLKQDRMDNFERRIGDLEQANRFMSERVKMLEKSVYDLKDKVDRKFLRGGFQIAQELPLLLN